jgi:hypothetical protein
MQQVTTATKFEAPWQIDRSKTHRE